MVTARRRQLYVAGAPRFNHTGKVIVFTMKNTGHLSILHSLLGQQVTIATSPPYSAGTTGSHRNLPSTLCWDNR